MKSSLILLIGLGIGAAAAIVYFKRQQTVPAPVLAVETSAAPAPAPAEVAVASKAALPAVVKPAEPVAAPKANPVASDPRAEALAAFRARIDALLSPQLTARQKHEMFEEFRKAGEIDQVIDELKRRATDNPATPALFTTLGEAQLNKVRALHDSGADMNEVGILAMQADQSFNAALKLDPKNWEANFVKASSMYYWPANDQRDNDVVQRLSGLIDQQESLPPNPAFAQTYLVLGNQFQKIGQPDKAMGTWQLGLQKFPNDPALQKKVNGQ